MNKKEILGLCELLKLHGYENTDNISKFIFGLQQENKQLKSQIEEYQKALDETMSEKIDIEDNCSELKKTNKKQKEVINKAVKYIDDLRDESAERQGFYNCFPDDLYIPDINELLQILDKAKGE